MKKQFIGRKKYLTAFENRLGLQEGGAIRYSGQPGIGKTTLLKELSKICNQEKRPYLWLTMEGLDLTSGSSILFELARSSRHFPEAHQVATEQHNKIERNWEHQEETVNTLMGALENIDSIKLAVGLVHTGIDLTQGLFKHKANKLNQQVLKNSELYLLTILANAGKQHPVCFFDTLEHLHKYPLKIVSRIEFNGDTIDELNEQKVPLSLWMRELSEFLQENGWIVVSAARDFIDRKSSKALERFSAKEIEAALQANRPYNPTYQIISPHF